MTDDPVLDAARITQWLARGDMAALKYLFYSMCGAYLNLFVCLPVSLLRYAGICRSTLDGAAASGHAGLLLVAVLAMLIGFGASGHVPLHAWLPAAHPLAPSPASAALSESS
ncbi:MAG: proton-conducting transporter membrane subunit [Gallintestinimicrobium sp.]